MPTGICCVIVFYWPICNTWTITVCVSDISVQPVRLYSSTAALDVSEILVFDLPGYEYAARPPFLLSAMLLKCIKLAVFSFYLTSESNGTVFLFSPPPPPPSLGRGYCSLQVKHKLCFCFAFNQFLNGCCPEIVFSPEGTEVGWAFRTIPEHFWVDRQKLQIMDVYPWRAARTITAFLAVTSKCTYAMWERWIFFCTLLGIESLWPLSITVCAVARLDVQETRFWFPAGAWIYLFLKASWSSLAPIQHPFWVCMGNFLWW